MMVNKKQTNTPTLSPILLGSLYMKLILGLNTSRGEISSLSRVYHMRKLR